MSGWLSGAAREREADEHYAQPEHVYPHAGTCANCGRDRDDLFWHAEDAVFYCADTFRCERRRYAVSRASGEDSR